MTDENWVRVLRCEDLPPGEMLGVEIGDTEVAIYNVGGAYYATNNICTHGFASLSDGYLEDDEIECPLHGGRFRVTDGAAVLEPAECPLQTYRVRTNEDNVEVLLPE
ncbi:MAG TPA: non-heme iron oxygenase ferredoxin subunit [Devosiaceae bacterium]|jgi:naphthalene 1,2-dioxygenase system ferredoxin subunit